MRIRSAGIAALVAAVGIWMSVPAEPAMAAKPAAKTAKTVSKATKANARAAKPAAKKPVAAAERPMVLSKFKKERRAHAAKKSRTAQVRHVKKSASKMSTRTPGRNATADSVETHSASAELPPAIANAHAQAFAEDQARNIAALDSTDKPVIGGMQLAAADETNVADDPPQIVAQDSGAVPAPPVAAAPEPAQSGKIIRAMPSGEKPVVKPADDSDPWSKTSLIGKIFIAFGSLLTLASAARLMIA